MKRILAKGRTVICFLFVILFFTLVPLYFRNGYEKIAEKKYIVLMYGSLGILGLYMIWGFFNIVSSYNHYEDAYAKKESGRSNLALDLSVLLYTLVSIISYWGSPLTKDIKYKDYWYKGSFFYGIKGWFMGISMVLLISAMYFIISRLFTYCGRVWIPMVVTAAIVFFFVVLNRYGFYPIDMKYTDSMFVSTIGHVDWLSGYESIVIPIIMGLFWCGISKKIDKLLVFPLILSLMMISLTSTESIVVSFGIVMIALFIFSLKSPKKMLRFSIIWLVFSIESAIIYLVDMIFKNPRTETSNMAGIFDGGAWSFLWLAASAALFIFVSRFSRSHESFSPFIEKKLGVIIAISLGSVILITISLIIINTYLENTLPILNKIGLFYFDHSWGNDRGKTLRIGAYIFKKYNTTHKLFGYGPDSFAARLFETPRALNIQQNEIGEALLTNSHNEFLTILDNQGILGLASYVAIIISALVTFIKKVKLNNVFIIFALVILMYIVNCTVSFQQILNTPQFFIILGIGASICRSETQELTQ